MFKDVIGDVEEIVFKVKNFTWWWWWLAICAKGKLKYNFYEWCKSPFDFLKL